MTDAPPPLLTIVLETQGELDRESTTYRRLLAARLKYEALYTIEIRDEELSASDVARLCSRLESQYVVFVRTSHQISADFLSIMITYLRSRNVYLAEPMMYAGAIPKSPDPAKAEAAYHYSRDPDLYGVAFNTRRLGEALEALDDLDRSAIYLGYRLYWSLGKVTPLPTGYSVASNTSAAIGIRIDPAVTRLVPLLATPSTPLRLGVLRHLTLFLRGVRGSGSSGVSLPHLRDLIQHFDLDRLVGRVAVQQPFEAAWIRWLHDPSDSLHLYKQLTARDAYLEFDLRKNSSPDAVPLYSIAFDDEVVSIAKSYRPNEERAGYDDPAVYNFYSRPITARSTILFFDRPMQADDNAEYLYEYFIHHHPEFEHAYFALNPKSADWGRLSAKGFRLVALFSKEFYEKFLVSDLVVSSQIYMLNYRGKSLANSRFVYLQHGVQLNDMSDWVNSKLFDVFVATGNDEAEYLRAMAPFETLNSGLPRMEALTRSPGSESHLLFMPTWRFGLHQASAGRFKRSEYFRAIDGLLTDRRLLAFLEETDRVLQVKLHPNVESRGASFRFSDRVVRSDLSYRGAIASAEMVFTDYSSAVLDAAFIGTPIAYYQWDAADFFDEQPYESRVDYTREGLGPVFLTHEEIVDHIVSTSYLHADPILDARRERFFAGVVKDGINATIVERMLSL